MTATKAVVPKARRLAAVLEAQGAPRAPGHLLVAVTRLSGEQHPADIHRQDDKGGNHRPQAAFHHHDFGIGVVEQHGNQTAHPGDIHQPGCVRCYQKAVPQDSQAYPGRDHYLVFGVERFNVHMTSIGRWGKCSCLPQRGVARKYRLSGSPITVSSSGGLHLLLKKTLCFPRMPTKRVMSTICTERTNTQTNVRYEREADIECKRTARPAFILNTDLSTTAELLSYRSLRKIPSHRLHLPVIFEEARDQYQHRTVRARQHSQKRL